MLLTASCSLKVRTLPFPPSSSPSPLLGNAIGVLIALELAKSGTGVRPSTSESLIELEFIASNVLASGSGVLPSSNPGFIAAGVAIFPFNKPLTCLVRFAVALFNMGVNSFFAFGFRSAASGLRGVEMAWRAPRICLKRLSRSAGAWKDGSMLRSRSAWVSWKRVWSATVEGVLRMCAMVGGFIWCYL
ncbi:uncharacterized protein BDR25DRAFT_76410 [Lindgomyces ingoldianus]|uniref:Uncharacterized protein n=1 Tax=Lindgomyces ingoldianus TaxID=673940 RepID=A0ACB6QHW4_9PLEO|nr:uncharacterized protein BDR25DRAFT_76410 [Lindgomyces ingoldianus]KAF2466579.1 hypothetical protein BDR25DRAFT_76410 [Lindgomyces ingoldianus]